jgi:hypothetical protein
VLLPTGMRMMRMRMRMDEDDEQNSICRTEPARPSSRRLNDSIRQWRGLCFVVVVSDSCLLSCTRVGYNVVGCGFGRLLGATWRFGRNVLRGRGPLCFSPLPCSVCVTVRPSRLLACLSLTEGWIVRDFDRLSESNSDSTTHAMQIDCDVRTIG